MIKSFSQFKNKITLYHGTCQENALEIINNGWKPINKYGNNMGNPNYLYLSSDTEDALWFAQQKGCNSIVKVSNIPIKYLKPDPEDEAGFTMEQLLYRITNTQIPAKFILTEPLNKSFFSHKN